MNKQLTPLQTFYKIANIHQYAFQEVYKEETKIIETALKALEIIKKKPYLLLFTDFNLTYEEFVEQAEEDYGNDLPTKEEYDLIKEVSK